MKYEMQDEIEVFRNEQGSITITSRDRCNDEAIISLNDDAARFVIKSMQEILKGDADA